MLVDLEAYTRSSSFLYLSLKLQYLLIVNLSHYLQNHMP